MELLGSRAGPALHELVRGARCVVLPSEIYENAPITGLPSAMASSTLIGGIPELLEPDRTGWLFDSGSVDQLAERLAQVWSCSAARLAAMGAAARERVEAEFSRERYLQSMLALYARLGVRLPQTALAASLVAA